MCDFCFREAGAGSSHRGEFASRQTPKAAQLPFHLRTPTNVINHLARVSGSEIHLSIPCKSTVSPSQVHHLDHSPKVHRAFAICQCPQTWAAVLASLFVFTCLGSTRHSHRSHQWVMTVCGHRSIRYRKMFGSRAHSVLVPRRIVHIPAALQTAAPTRR